MIEWKKLNPGDKVIYSWDEFDGYGSVKGTVIEAHDDHVIVFADGQHLWIDDDNFYMIAWDIMDNI